VIPGQGGTSICFPSSTRLLVRVLNGRKARLRGRGHLSAHRCRSGDRAAAGRPELASRARRLVQAGGLRRADPTPGSSLWIGDGMPRASPSAKPRNGPTGREARAPFTRGAAALRPESLADDALESLKFAVCTLAPSQKLRKRITGQTGVIPYDSEISSLEKISSVDLYRRLPSVFSSQCN
jgi:hypothetical protein